MLILRSVSAPPLRPRRLLRNSLRYLCVLGVSAVEKCAPDLYRRDAENAEVAHRSSFKSFICFYQRSRAARRPIYPCQKGERQDAEDAEVTRGKEHLPT